MTDSIRAAPSLALLGSVALAAPASATPFTAGDVYRIGTGRDRPGQHRLASAPRRAHPGRDARPVRRAADRRKRGLRAAAGQRDGELGGACLAQRRRAFVLATGCSRALGGTGSISATGSALRQGRAKATTLKLIRASLTLAPKRRLTAGRYKVVVTSASGVATISTLLVASVA